MSTYYQDANTTILHGDCIETMRGMPEDSVDSIVTDPPYGLSNTTPDQVAETIVKWVSGDREYLPSGKGFMGKEWDGFVPPVAVWDEAMRVLKPGGHLIAFAGSRTHDLMTLGIRLAGFEIRDSVAWLYGSGFPKSMDISKAIDKMAGAEREVIGKKAVTRLLPNNVPFGEGLISGHHGNPVVAGEVDITAPATSEAQQWEGWGTALKPAYEPAVMARKPFTGTVASNVLEHGTGAINIDACRVSMSDAERSVVDHRSGVSENRNSIFGVGQRPEDGVWKSSPSGRFPANLILDEHTAELLDKQSGDRPGFSTQRDLTANRNDDGLIYGRGLGVQSAGVREGYNDSGGASRFFYCAKAGKSERPNVDGVAHPTVKPLALMRYLAKLVTPTGGTILDPFAGSGTTIEAAILEGFNVIGIERETEYLPLIQHRINRANEGKP